MPDSYLFKSPIGILRIGEEDGKITQVSLQRQSENTLLEKRGQHSDLLYEAYRQLNEYFQGKRMRFDLPVSSSGTAFQESVWRELRRIPYGETRSYEDIAVRVGNPRAVRAVGGANNKNPVLILIPCHRVIYKNGDISGFACGIEAKRYLLELESGHCY